MIKYHKISLSPTSFLQQSLLSRFLEPFVEQAFACGFFLAILPSLAAINPVVKEVNPEVFEGQFGMVLALLGNGLEERQGHGIFAPAWSLWCAGSRWGRDGWVSCLGEGL